MHVVTLALDAGSGYGGAEKLAFELALRLDPDRFKSVLCMIRRPFADRAAANERDRRALAEAGVELVRLDQRLPFVVTPAAWRRLHALLARDGVDVLHAHMPRASVPGSLLAHLAKVPVIISHEHGSLLEGKFWRRWLERQVVARFSTTILSVSEWDRRQLIELERIPPEQISVLPNGILPPPPPQGGEREVLRRELSLPAEAPLIGAVGRLYPEKGYDDLISAVDALRRRGRAVHCVIAGLGPQEAELRSQIARIGLEETVTLIGRRDDIPAFVRALDVAVLPSKREGVPLALLEYMALGAPIVAAAVGGVPEVVGDRREALLADREDPEGLAGAVQELLDDPDLAQRLGAAARERQRSRYDLEVIVRRVEDLYVELMTRAGAGASWG